MAKRNLKPSAGRSQWERQRDAIRAAKAAQAPAATASENGADLTTGEPSIGEAKIIVARARPGQKTRAAPSKLGSFVGDEMGVPLVRKRRSTKPAFRSVKAGQLLAEQRRVEPAESRHGQTSAAESPIQAPPAPRFTFPPPAEPAPAPPEPAAGTYRIDQLRFGQCRFACTSFEARSHRFCGQPTEIGPGNLHGSWCAEHLPVVTCAPGRSAGGASKADVGAPPDPGFRPNRQGAWRGFGVARHRDLGGEA